MPPTACASTATQPTPDIGSRTRFGVLMSADNVRPAVRHWDEQRANSPSYSTYACSSFFSTRFVGCLHLLCSGVFFFGVQVSSSAAIGRH